MHGDCLWPASSVFNLGTVQGNAAVAVLKKALSLQASPAAQLIEAMPQLALATSGAVATQVNRYA